LNTARQLKSFNQFLRVISFRGHYHAGLVAHVNMVHSESTSELGTDKPVVTRTVGAINRIS